MKAPRHALHCGDLVDQLGLHILGAFAGYTAAAEAVNIHERRVGADRDAPCLGGKNGVAHDNRIAGMKTAGDVCRGNQLHHRFVFAHGPGPEAFSHIAVQIDRRHSPSFRARYCPASSSSYA